MRTIIVTGANGQVGWELQRTLAPLGKVIALDRKKLDLANADQIRAVLRELKPDAVINAAAYTAVDRAEQEAELAHKINSVAPGIMAEETLRLKALFVHFSTDYVFDGTKASPYREEDPPNPMGVYGRTKLAGEQAIQAVGGNFLILRTSWVYGLRGANFLKTILRLACEREELRIVDDQIGSPTWSRMLAEVTAQILGRSERSFAELCDYSGLYHLSAGGATTWFEFAKKITARASHLPDYRLKKTLPIPTTEYPTPAQRPAYSVLANSLFQDRFQLAMPEWDNMLDLCLQDFI